MRVVSATLIFFKFESLDLLNKVKHAIKNISKIEIIFKKFFFIFPPCFIICGFPLYVIYLRKIIGEKERYLCYNIGIKKRGFGMKRVVNIFNEFNSLKKVILHRPGNEFLNLIPNNLSMYSFKDIPDLDKMQKEHDAYANLLRKDGVDVIYLIDLMVECLNINANIKDKFIKQFIKEADIKISFVYNEIYHLLSSIEDNRKLVNKCIEGIRYSEIKVPNSSFFKIDNSNGLAIEPLINLCFVHNIMMGLGNDFIISSQKNDIQNRNSIFFEYIFKYHPKYKNSKVYNDRYNNNLVSTGDIIVLNDEVLCIGITNTTTSVGICNLANQILKDKKYKYIIVLDVNDKLNEFKLDSLFSMIDNDIFLIHNDLLDNLNIYELSLHNEKLVINSLHLSFNKTLEKYLHLKQLTLIKCGNGNYFDYEREQRHQVINLLSTKPKSVLSFKINHITNNQLSLNEMIVNEINSNEFLKGSGGIHSLVIPLIRDK